MARKIIGELLFQRCTVCDELKPSAAFYMKNGATIQSRCRKCCSKKTKEWVTANPDKRKASARHWRESRKPSPGVYIVANTTDGKVYVGSTNDLDSRKKGHYFLLKHNRNNNPHLQAAWNECGSDSFVFVVLCECTKDKLRDMEQHFMDSFGSMDRNSGYNVGTANGFGIIPSPETRQLMSSVREGRKVEFTPEWRANISAARKGKLLTEEHKRKIGKSQANKQRLSAEQVNEIREQLAAGVSQYRLRRIYKCGGSIIPKIMAGKGNYGVD